MKDLIEKLEHQAKELTILIDKARLERVETFEKIAQLKQDLQDKHPEAYETQKDA